MDFEKITFEKKSFIKGFDTEYFQFVLFLPFDLFVKLGVFLCILWHF